MHAPAPDWLLADIGGTHARFALSASGAAPRALRVYRCADYASPLAAIAAYLAATGAAPTAACLALAGPTGGAEVRLTNHDWTITQAALSATFGFSTVLFLNDFEALALALPQLDAEESASFGAGGSAQTGAPMVVLGPGTGLGVATLVPVAGRWLALPGEGGHVGFAPQDARQAEVARVLLRQSDRVSNEDILSGRGLAALHAALAEIDGVALSALSAPALIDAALAGADARALATLECFIEILGAVAGDIALVVGARGGVHIGGGIVPRLQSLDLARRFRASFEAKGVQRGYVAAIPTRLIVAPAPALLGAVAALAARLG